MADQDKALIASTEFDPSQFIAGIDKMTQALTALSQKEDELKQKIAANNQELINQRKAYSDAKDAIAQLDKTSQTYGQDLIRLKQQQQDAKASQQQLNESIKQSKQDLANINKATIEYKNALTILQQTIKQVHQETKGRTLFDVASLNKQIQEISQMGARLRNVFKGKIDDSELRRFEQQIASTDDEMQQLAQTVAFVKGKLELLDPNTQEFADLTQVVQVGEQVLEEFGKTTEKVDQKSVSMRKQLRVLRDEMQILENQGKDNTEEFNRLQIAAAKLQDQISDTQRRIKVLASDTKNLDFGIGVARAAAASYGLMAGAAELFGAKSEDVLKTIARLNSVMAILNGLQELQTLLQKQSVVSIVGKEIATKALVATQRIYTFTVGTSVGALKAFRLALLATGLGAFVVLLGVAAKAMGLFGSKTEESDNSVKNFTTSLADLDIKLKGATDKLVLQTDLAVEKAKQRGATEIEQSKLRINQYIKEKEILQKAFTDLNNNLDKELRAGTGKLKRLSTEAEEELFEKYEARREQLQSRFDQLNNIIALETEKLRTKQIEDARRNAEQQAQLYQAYLERLIALQRAIRDRELSNQRQDEKAIRQRFSAQLQDMADDIDQEVKSGKLTKQRGAVLKNLVAKLNKADLDKALSDFNKEVEATQREFEQRLTDLRLQSAEERANMLRNVVDRETAAISVSFERQKVALERDLKDQILSIQKAFEDGLISEDQALENKQAIEQIYADLLANLTIITARRSEDLANTVFQRGQAEISNTFRAIALNTSEAATEEILRVSALYTSGKINYQKYQAELTRINRDESVKRINQQMLETQALLEGVLLRQKVEQDPERQKDLQQQVIQLRQQLTDLRRQLTALETQEIQQQDQEQQARIQRIAGYAQAIGQLTDSVVRFWQLANQAEHQALERSISLQNKRVEAARRIAERGNAEYLRLEEDRLNELQIRQENAARRQLAINAVLQTSQALVAFTSALAQGIATGGPIGGIAIAAAVLGLLAAGYSIVQSIQPRQRLKHGTKKVERGSAPPGEDTVPAMLTEGEAVVPKRKNEAYQATVHAIMDETVPPEVLNKFVKAYHIHSRTMPSLDYGRLEQAAHIIVTYDGRLVELNKQHVEKLEENNVILRRVHKALINMGVNVNVDRRGLAISVMEVLDEAERQKRV